MENSSLQKLTIGVDVGGTKILTGLVDENGKVKALKKGQATITASAGNVTVSCLVRVT